jgi:hypothetical protein
MPQRSAPSASKRHAWAACALAACLLAACGNDGAQEGEDYGNLLASPGGLLVLEVEHPTGWGRPDCVACHERRNAHNENRTGLANCEDVADDTNCIDLEEVRDLIRRQGQQSCPQCHGDNGVQE